MQNAGVGKDSFVSRLLDDASAFDLDAGGEPDLQTFIKRLSITIYTGTNICSRMRAIADQE